MPVKLGLHLGGQMKPLVAKPVVEIYDGLFPFIDAAAAGKYIIFS